MTSFVTCPTSIKAVFCCFAIRCNAAEHSRTWETDPGELERCESCNAWMLSMIAMAGYLKLKNNEFSELTIEANPNIVYN